MQLRSLKTLVQVFRRRVLVIRLWRWNTFQAELCLFAPGTVIDWHRHVQQDIEIKHLWGVAEYKILKCKKEISYIATPLDTWPLRSFSIRMGTPHAARVGWFGLITLSVQHWNALPDTVTQDYKDIPDISKYYGK